MKECKGCKELKSLDDYHKSTISKDGLNSYCKVCRCAKQKIYVKNNKKMVYEKKKKWRELNKEEIKISRHKYYKKNKEFENTRSNEWNKLNRENTKEYRNSYSRSYYKKNKPLMAWRRILHSSIKRMNTKKEGHTIDILGYSSLDLKNHIEGLFTIGMSWENYGEWHIDHIKPIVLFDKDTPMSIVNHLSNLRPLWSVTRIIDGITYIGNLNRSKFIE